MPNWYPDTPSPLINTTEGLANEEAVAQKTGAYNYESALAKGGPFDVRNLQGSVQAVHDADGVLYVPDGYLQRHDYSEPTDNLYFDPAVYVASQGNSPNTPAIMGRQTTTFGQQTGTHHSNAPLYTNTPYVDCTEPQVGELLQSLNAEPTMNTYTTSDPSRQGMAQMPLSFASTVADNADHASFKSGNVANEFLNERDAQLNTDTPYMQYPDSQVGDQLQSLNAEPMRDYSEPIDNLYFDPAVYLASQRNNPNTTATMGRQTTSFGQTGTHHSDAPIYTNTPYVDCTDPQVGELLQSLNAEPAMNTYTTSNPSHHDFQSFRPNNNVMRSNSRQEMAQLSPYIACTVANNFKIYSPSDASEVPNTQLFDTFNQFDSSTQNYSVSHASQSRYKEDIQGSSLAYDDRELGSRNSEHIANNAIIKTYPLIPSNHNQQFSRPYDYVMGSSRSNHRRGTTQMPLNIASTVSDNAAIYGAPPASALPQPLPNMLNTFNHHLTQELDAHRGSKSKGASSNCHSANARGGVLADYNKAVVSIKDFPRVKNETRSKCCWGQCDMIIDNSSRGLQDHLLEVHHTETTVAGLMVECYWGSCNGAVYSGGTSFVKHIRGTHLRLEDIICPYCDIVIANGVSPARKHMLNRHKEIKLTR